MSCDGSIWDKGLSHSGVGWRDVGEVALDGRRTRCAGRGNPENPGGALAGAEVGVGGCPAVLAIFWKWSSSSGSFCTRNASIAAGSFGIWPSGVGCGSCKGLIRLASATSLKSRKVSSRTASKTARMVGRCNASSSRRARVCISCARMSTICSTLSAEGWAASRARLAVSSMPSRCAIMCSSSTTLCWRPAIVCWA